MRGRPCPTQDDNISILDQTRDGERAGRGEASLVTLTSAERVHARPIPHQISLVPRIAIMPNCVDCGSTFPIKLVAFAPNIIMVEPSMFVGLNGRGIDSWNGMLLWRDAQRFFFRELEIDPK